MSTKGEVLYHPVTGAAEQTWDGFSWPAFFFGIFWLLVKELNFRFIFALALVLVTGGLAAPIVWLLCGAIGNRAYKKSLLRKGYLTERQWKAKEKPDVEPARFAIR